MSHRPDRRTPLSLRLLGVAAAALLLLSLALASSRDRAPGIPSDDGASAPLSAPDGGDPAEHTQGPGDVDAAASTSDAPGDVTLLLDLEAAAAAGPSDLLRAGATAATNDWAALTHPAWRDRLPVLPVYVGEATLRPDRVEADLVLAFEHDGSDQLVLRFVPAARPLDLAGAGATLEALDGNGAPMPVELDIDGARAILALAGTPPGPTSIRLRFAYDIPALAGIRDDGGPAGFGLLASHGDAAMLGHWLPLLTFAPEPMVPWGDVGAFPPAVFSVQVTSPATVVSGGRESPCPMPATDCTWARGVGLRDLAVALFEDPTVATAGAGVVATGRATLPAGRAQTVADESAAAMTQFSDQLGPLPWADLDVVLLSLRAAAGMEFPGLVIVDPEYVGRLQGGFGTFVAVHEVAHQWFHALVGNSSLDDAVVDESLAQYLSRWFYQDQYGPAAAEDLFQRYLVARYRGARSSGMVDVAPASSSDAFRGDADYGPLIYARAPLAWSLAEQELGRPALQEFIASLVDRHGLGILDARQVVAEAREQLPALAVLLERWWFDPAPVTP